MSRTHPNAAGDRPMYSAETLAARLAISTRTVRELLARGVIPSYVIEHIRRVDPADVDRYLRERRRPSAADAAVASLLGTVADAIAELLARGEIDDESRTTLAGLSRLLNSAAADIEGMA